MRGRPTEGSPVRETGEGKEENERKTKHGVCEPACTPASWTPFGTKAHPPPRGQHSQPAPLPRGCPKGYSFICGGRHPATAPRTSSGTWEEEGTVRTQEGRGTPGPLPMKDKGKVVSRPRREARQFLVREVAW